MKNFINNLLAFYIFNPKANRLLKPFYLVIKFFIKPFYYFNATRKYKNVTIRNSELKNKYVGKKAFLLFTGPSIDNIDFEYLQNEICFTSSFVYKHEQFNKLNNVVYAVPDYHKTNNCTRMLHSVHSTRNTYTITPQNFQVILDFYYSFQLSGKNNHLDPNKAALFFYSALEKSCNIKNTKFLVNPFNKIFIEKNNLLKYHNLYYVLSSYRTLRGSKLSDDLAGKFSFYNGSIYFLIGAAIYMGFNEIYLLGADYTVYPRRHFHFFDHPIFSKSFSKSELIKVVTKFAENHETEVQDIIEYENYYKPIFVQRKQPEPYHKIMKKFAEEAGVKIYTVNTQESNSPFYEKVSWEEVLLKISKSNL